MRTRTKAIEPWENNLQSVQDGSIEAGLLCLTAVARTGRRYSHREIAKACGITKTAIFEIEKRALKKLLHRMREFTGEV